MAMLNVFSQDHQERERRSQRKDPKQVVSHHERKPRCQPELNEHREQQCDVGHPADQSELGIHIGLERTKADK